MSLLRSHAVLTSGLVGLLLALPAADAEANRGQKIAQKVEKAWKGYTGEEFGLELKLLNASGGKAVHKMNGKISESGDSEKMLLSLTYPPSQKGVKLLTWSHPKQADDQWLYLPTIKKAKRISSRGRSGSFLGSEFAYEDLISPWQSSRYKHKFLKEQKVGSHKTWKLERYPRDRHSGYSKQVVWFDQKYLVALRIDYYDRKGKLLKTASFEDFNKYSGKWRSDRIEVKNHQTGKKSILVWKKRNFGKSYEDDTFSPGALKF